MCLPQQMLNGFMKLLFALLASCLVVQSLCGAELPAASAGMGPGCKDEPTTIFLMPCSPGEEEPLSLMNGLGGKLPQWLMFLYLF